MTRYTAQFERARARYGSPPITVEQVLRRHDRKRRRERVSSLVLALLITGALVGAALAAWDRGGRQVPAGPQITSSNVGQLHEVASNITTPDQQGFRIATGGGVLVMGTSQYAGEGGAVIAYPLPCGGLDARCPRLWRASLDGPGLPTVVDGTAYVSSLRGSDLAAFDIHCATDGRTCGPLWTASPGRSSSNEPPLVIGDRLYVGVEAAGGGGAVVAFDTACAGRCAALWSVATDRPVRVLTYADGVLFAGTGRPGPADPSDAGGVTALRLSACALYDQAGCVLWHHDTGQVWDLAVDAGMLFVGTNGHSEGVQAYATTCVEGGGRCGPAWVGATKCCTRLSVANGSVFAEDQIGHAYAFPVACGSQAQRCEPAWVSTGTIDPPFIDFNRPLVAGDLVFLGGDAGWLYGFSTECPAICTPTWKTLVHDMNGRWGNWDATVSGDRLYVAAADGLHVFSAALDRPGVSAAAPTAAVSSSTAGGAPFVYGGLALVGSAILAVTLVRRRRFRP
jgi:hypothetical protein